MTDIAVNANDFDWEVVFNNAGIITSLEPGNFASIIWNDDYLGNAAIQLEVKASCSTALENTGKVLIVPLLKV